MDHDNFQIYDLMFNDIVQLNDWFILIFDTLKIRKVLLNLAKKAIIIKIIFKMMYSIEQLKNVTCWNNHQHLKSPLNKKFLDSLDKNCRMIMFKIQKLTLLYWQWPWSCYNEHLRTIHKEIRYKEWWRLQRERFYNHRTIKWIIDDMWEFIVCIAVNLNCNWLRECQIIDGKHFYILKIQINGRKHYKYYFWNEGKLSKDIQHQAYMLFVTTLIITIKTFVYIVNFDYIVI